MAYIVAGPNHNNVRTSQRTMRGFASSYIERLSTGCAVCSFRNKNLGRLREFVNEICGWVLRTVAGCTFSIKLFPYWFAVGILLDNWKLRHPAQLLKKIMKFFEFRNFESIFPFSDFEKFHIFLILIFEIFFPFQMIWYQNRKKTLKFFEIWKWKYFLRFKISKLIFLLLMILKKCARWRSFRLSNKIRENVHPCQGWYQHSSTFIRI